MKKTSSTTKTNRLNSGALQKGSTRAWLNTKLDLRPELRAKPRSSGSKEEK